MLDKQTTETPRSPIQTANLTNIHMRIDSQLNRCRANAGEVSIHRFGSSSHYSYWQIDVKSMLLVREDRQDLSVEDVQILCEWTSEKLMPMFKSEYEGSLGNRYRQHRQQHSTASEIRSYITKENFDDYKMVKRMAAVRIGETLPTVGGEVSLIDL